MAITAPAELAPAPGSDAQHAYTEPRPDRPAPEEPLMWAPRGWELKRGKFATNLGMYGKPARGAPSTTRQVEILNTAVIAAPTDDEGIINGRDRLSRTTVAHDPGTAYRKKTVSSPNSCILGDVGSGKTTEMKSTFFGRQLLLDLRLIVNLDKKEEQGEGEMSAMTRAAGSEPIKLWPGTEGSRLNLMDPKLLLGAAGDGGQYGVLRATAELLQNGTALTPFEEKMLRTARRTALVSAEDKGRVPWLDDLLADLGNVDRPEFARMSIRAREELELAGLRVKFLFERLPEEFGGLFDGDTSNDVRLGEKVTTFDIHRLDDGPSVSIAMMLIQTWLLGHLRSYQGITQLNIPEGWHLVGGPTGKVVRSNAKLARALGLAMCVDFHHISDFPLDDPAIAFLREAQSIYLYRQSRDDDAAACERLFGLRPGTGNALMTLETGTRYIKIGTKPEILVDHVLSDLEAKLTNTDSALTGGKGRNL